VSSANHPPKLSDQIPYKFSHNTGWPFKTIDISHISTSLSDKAESEALLKIFRRAVACNIARGLFVCPLEDYHSIMFHTVCSFLTFLRTSTP
jgi:hypothetical protein